MTINEPVQVITEASVIVGYMKETLREEQGSASRLAIEAIKERPHHILRVSKAICQECTSHFEKESRPGYWILKTLFAPFVLKEKIKRVSYDPEEIEVNVSVPEHDRHVAEAAIAVKTKNRRIKVCLVTKNLRDFDQEEWHDQYDILVMSPEDFVADP